MLHRAAGRYARALLDLAGEQGVAEAVRADADRLAALWSESAELAAFAGDYALPRAARRRVLDQIFGGRLHELTWRFVRFLEERKRLGLLGDVCAALGAMDDRRRGRVEAWLDSPFEVPAAETQAIAARLAERIGRTVRIRATVAPELLGGFRLRVEDRLYDLSLAGALDAYRRKAAGMGV
jgi:F-type H+-transporting ATPase subunit delta